MNRSLDIADLASLLTKEQCALIADALDSVNPEDPDAAIQARELAQLFTGLTQRLETETN